MLQTSDLNLNERNRFQGLFAKEMKIMANIDHDNIVRLKGVLKSPLAIVEYVNFSFLNFGVDKSVNSLKEFLSVLDECDGVDGFRDQGFFDKIVTDVGNELKYLHDHDIVHIDLKPGNVLVSNLNISSIQCKITDFGESRTNALKTQNCFKQRRSSSTVVQYHLKLKNRFWKLYTRPISDIWSWLIFDFCFNWHTWKLWRRYQHGLLPLLSEKYHGHQSSCNTIMKA